MFESSIIFVCLNLRENRANLLLCFFLSIMLYVAVSSYCHEYVYTHMELCVHGLFVENKRKSHVNLYTISGVNIYFNSDFIGVGWISWFVSYEYMITIISTKGVWYKVRKLYTIPKVFTIFNLLTNLFLCLPTFTAVELLW